jgi:hypothetical protein
VWSYGSWPGSMLFNRGGLGPFFYRMAPPDEF